MTTVNLEIAGFRVRVCVGDAFPGFAMPKAFAPFTLSAPAADPLFTLTVEAGTPPSLEGLEPVATGINDIGEARLYPFGDDYAVALSLFPGSGFRIMTTDRAFTRARLILAPGDPYAAYAVDSMLRIIFSQAIVARGAFLLHASAIVASGRAVLFMGKSGTGKSTHAALWQSEFADAVLLNDDNPVVRVLPDGSVRAYGSPWSGKTPCYRNESAPVGAFIRLRQAPDNAVAALADIDAFVAILPGVSVITHDRELYDSACSVVIEAADAVRVGRLDCRPDAAAARLSRAFALGPENSAVNEC